MQRHINKIAIIGIGNLVMGDDGVGIHVVEALGREDLPPHVGVFDCATRAFDVLESIDGTEKAVIVDACKRNNAPGTIYRFRLDPAGDVADESFNLSLHDINFTDALRAGREIYRLPHDIVIIGVEPGLLDWGTELSEGVKSALPRIIEAVRAEVPGWDNTDSLI